MDNKIICPGCGFENRVDSDLLDSLNNCKNCSHPLYVNKNNYFIKLIAIFLTLFAMVLLLNNKYSVLNLRNDFFEIIYQGLVILIISSFFASGRFFEKFRHFIAWIGIFALALTIYSYRIEIKNIKDRVVSQLIPGRGVESVSGSISFPKASDGHYYISALINGTPILFLADTGASTIVLTPEDGKKLGYNPESLKFDRVFSTANGRVRGSSIKLNSLSLGDLNLKNIPASINQAEMGTSLLGMTFFQTLRRFEIKNNTLTIYWN